jgi:hypothetical protein
MSRIEKLKVLLARVEQRRAEPRLVAVSNASALPSANTNVAGARPLELAPSVRAAPAQEPIAPTAPSSIPPPPSTRSSSLPPMTRTPLPPPPSTAASSSVPPAHSSEPLSRAHTEVLPATQLPAAPPPTTPTRIAPTPVTAAEPAVFATSAARVEAPRTFGELLERSLALRPKSG